ncbi:hypothetical protein ONE63_010142 [Megalurothrips usitatus]|uniref:Ketosynthase family 3 (KS3) domain-containing protein n=1 Tax=Megalurothrips usitatus TaxID=439358 RepID=A0AAV7XJQ6_9NEOP|nr:hypothetical protein ONE63_010142 [Megalurothrips usitatus]
MSHNINAFADNILENRSLLQKTDRDNQLEIEPVAGQIGFEHFDDVFYGVSKKLAKNMDPTAKLGYLRSFEAVVDAGVHPAALRGSNTAVFTGSGINEFEQKILLSDVTTQLGGYVIMGVNRSMSANRISYYFDFRGPSVALDSSFAVGHLELKAAADAIRSGECDAALVLSCSIARFPQTSWLLKNLGVVTGDTVTRSFDQNGTGAVRSDAAVAFFLQRADQAKRCYATVLAAGLEMVGPRSDLAPNLPSTRGMQAFLSDLYRRNSIDPRTVAYLEADGCGHPIRDECELNAVDAALVQGPGRSGPLLVGSVKSNIGHTDSVSGFAGICKAIVAMETGVIPATINFETPNAAAVGLQAGRLKVVDRNTDLEEGVVAVNTLGLFAQVGHTVLRANPRAPSPPQDPSQHLPRLVTLAGRTEGCVRSVASELLSVPFDTNYYRLVQDAFSDDIRGYEYRSYVICPPEEADAEPPRAEKRTVWFVYSGMGSQWAGMGAGLMRLPIFAETIERLHAVLEPKGVDLKHVITETGPTAFDNILKSFVGIAACQIALTNVLRAVGIVPDGIVGHSAGELGCAYGDGCLTEEQTILAAWARGYASNKATVIKGMMAAVGLGYKDVLPRLPHTIDVACHNSDASCTVSGPAEDVQAFVEQLSDEGVFARAVNVSDIAYHSRYIQPAGPLLREYLEAVIPVPKQRSPKWITTSVPPHLQDTDLGKFCSVEYQVNNLLSPVLFEEALQFVPKQSLLVEVAPHGLMQAILTRALPDPLHVPLTQRGHKDPLRFLLAAIGKTSAACTAPRVSALYPDVEYPVPRGTASVGRLVAWQTDETTYNDLFKELEDWVSRCDASRTPSFKLYFFLSRILIFE